MLRAHEAAEIVAAEEPLLAQGEPLMLRAARAVELLAVDLLRERRARISGSRVLVLAGSGNNGGDGLFAAAGLARRGARVSVLLVGAAAHDAGLAAVRATSARVLIPLDDADAVARAIELLTGCDLVLDAVAGIGIRGGLRGRAGAVVNAVAQALPALAFPPTVLAVDTPSGIGADDGAVPGPVLPADYTVTVGAAKPGLLLPPAAALAGRIGVVDLGLLLPGTPAAVRLSELDIADLWHAPSPSEHKYSRGVLGIVAGSDAYPGAAVLASSAAAPLTGMVRFDGPPIVASHVLHHRPEVVVGTGRVQAWQLGSGIGPDDDARLARVREVLTVVLAADPAADPSTHEGSTSDGSTDAVPVVVDAGGLQVLPDRVPASVVLTPHAGELSRLLTARGQHVERSAVEAEPVRWLKRAVELTGATVLLKGSITLVAGPGTPIYSQANGTGWLASAGSGDVLAGLLGAMLAGASEQVMADPSQAAKIAAAAAAVHGMAARRLGGPLVALDLARTLPDVVADLLSAALPK